jgi:molybdopterin-guanine dinucleotide biosynthesis protein MobB
LLPMISFVGPHNVGKTTVLVKVLSCLVDRGIKVGVIKHAAHGFDLENSYKDSERLFGAGAAATVVTSPGQMAMYRRVEKELTVWDIREEIADDVELVIVEGFKREKLPKIEVLRQEISTTPLDLENRVAVVCDFDIEGLDVPVFSMDDVAGISDFITENYLKSSGKTKL